MCQKSSLSLHREQTGHCKTPCWALSPNAAPPRSIGSEARRRSLRLPSAPRRSSAVDKIFGPGNAFVIEAKRQAFGTVGVDLLPGPSEILVIADESAEPDWIAADLLAQSEHGKGSIAILLTDSSRVLDAVAASLRRQINLSRRRKELSLALRNAKLVLVRDLRRRL